MRAGFGLAGGKVFLTAQRGGFCFPAGKTVPCSRSEQERLLESPVELKVPQVAFAPCPTLFWCESGDYADTVQILLVPGGTTEGLW